MARDQFVLKSFAYPIIMASGNELQTKESDTEVVVQNDGFRASFSKTSGALLSWKVLQKELLIGSLEPYFWKPANDNQKMSGFERELGKWKTAGEKRIVEKMEVTKKEGIVSVQFKMKLPTIGAEYQLDYRLNGGGKIQVGAVYQPSCDTIPLIPKFGMRMQIPDELTTVDWYGRGP